MPPAVRLGLAALLLSLSGLAGADVLVSANGDRIKGRLVEQRDGVLVFDSELLGRLEVPADRARIEPDADAASAVPAVAGEAAPAKPAAEPRAPPRKWSSDLGVRLAVDRGSLETPEDDLRVSLKGQRPTRHGVLNSGFDFRRRTTDDALRDDDWNLQFGYERFLDEDYFIAGRALAIRELAGEGYDETQAVLVAAGWRLWEGEGQHLRVGPALGYLSARRGDGQVDAPGLGLYATAEGQAWGKVRFSSKLIFLDARGDGRYADLELRLRQPLGERLYLALVWDYAWSDFDIEPGARSEWRWDLGWRFGPDASR